MIGQREKILGPGALIQLQQLFRIPILGLPFVNDILEAELGRRPIMLDMVFIIRGPLLIHLPGIPIPVLRLALRAPMRPDAELGIPKPLGNLVVLEGFPRRFEFSGLHWFRLVADR